MTEEEFRANVATNVADSSSFVEAVYKTVDETIATEKEVRHQWACKKKCSACCMQMVSISVGEWEGIVNFLNSLGKKMRRIILQRANKQVTKYRKWLGQVKGDPRLQDPIWLGLQWEDQPCPFLGPSGICSVYEARPMVCRTHRSTTTCSNIRNPDIVLFAYQCENWANTMIFEHQQQTIGQMAATPVHHFLMLGDKRIKD